MTLDIHTGTFLIKCGTGTQAITAPGFTPKAIIFQVTDQTSTGAATNQHESIGWTVGTGTCDEFVQAHVNDDGSKCGNKSVRNSAILLINQSATTLLEANLNSFDCCGFTICIGTNTCKACTIVAYTAIGGSCLTNAAANCFCVPCTTGCNTVSNVGFQLDTILVQYYVCQTTIPSVSNKQYFSWGIADRATGNEWSISGVRKSECGMCGKVSTDLCGVNFLGNSKKPNCFCGQANFVSAGTGCCGNFVFNVTDASMNASKGAYLALEYDLCNVCTDVGTFTKATGTCTPVTQNVTSLCYQANFIMLVSNNDAVGNSNACVENFSGSSNFTNEYTIGNTGRDGTCCCKDSIIKTDKVLSLFTAGSCGAPTLVAEADATTNACGFTLTWTTNCSNARGIGFWALKGAAGGCCLIEVIPLSTVGITCANVRLGNQVRLLSENVNLNEGIERLGVLTRNLPTENVNINESNNRLGGLLRRINESVNITEDIIDKLTGAGGVLIKLINENVNINEGLSRLGTWVRNIAESVNINEGNRGVRGTFKVVPTEDISLSEASDRQFSCITTRIKFDDTVVDTVMCNNGVWTGTETYVAGPLDKAGCFDGCSSVKLDNESQFDWLSCQPISITMWVNPTDIPGNKVMWSKGNSGCTSKTQGSVQTNERMRFVMQDGGLSVITTCNGIPIGKFSHVAWTYNGSTDASGMKIYFDGALACSGVCNDTLSGQPTNNAQFVIGATSNGNNPFPGKIDDIQIYTKELTADEVRRMAQGPIPVKGMLRRQNENVNINEANNRLGGLLRRLAESINITEGIVRFGGSVGGALLKVINENVNITEGLIRLGGLLRRINENVNITEGLVRLGSQVRNITESVNINEGVVRLGGILKRINENVNINEGIVKLGGLIRNIGENVNITEVNQRLRTMVRNIAESVNITEVNQRLRTMVRNIAENVNITEGVIRLGNQLRRINENVNITEGLLRIRGLVRNIGENVNITEGVIRLGGLLRRINENVNITEGVVRLGSLVRRLEESVNINEGIVRLGGLLRRIAESVNITEGIIKLVVGAGVILKVINESVNINEVNQRLRTMVRNIGESVNITENITRLGGLIRNLAESVNITENITRLGGLIRNLAESVNITEGIVRLGSQVRNIAESVNINEVNQRLRTMVRNIAENVNITEGVIRLGGLLRRINENVNITEGLLRIRGLVRNIVESVNITEGIIRLGGLIRNIAENVNITEVNQRLKTMVRNIGENVNITEGVVRLGSLVRRIAESVNITEGIVKLVTSAGELIKLINESVNITEANNRFRAMVRNIAESVNITEGLVRLGSQVRNIAESINITEGLLRIRGLVRNISESININEGVIRLGGILKRINESVNVTEGLVRLRALIRNITENINITEGIKRIGGGFVKVIAETLRIREVIEKIGGTDIVEIAEKGGSTVWWRKRKIGFRDTRISPFSLRRVVDLSIAHSYYIEEIKSAESTIPLTIYSPSIKTIKSEITVLTPIEKVFTPQVPLGFVVTTYTEGLLSFSDADIHKVNRSNFGIVREISAEVQSDLNKAELTDKEMVDIIKTIEELEDEHE